MTQADPVDPATAAQLLGRDFATAIVVFHESVGRLLGLSAVERKCLDLLKRLGPVTAGAIGEHTGLTTGAITRMLDRLSKAGYVERVADPHDRRKVVVRLLPNERMDALLAMAFGPFAADMTEIAGHYDQTELRAILDWTRRTTEALRANTRRINDSVSPAD
ncbi:MULTISPECIES: MarR family transcriptional regulator [unclassified Crossiella]|uniref:MarR family winged helix-turn-helix transcriptional regulator n=1 Tax=unclassified Crossiella TaxID=2620835 RepID=UPI001FFFEB46|nr:MULTISPECIES: MarR family transcriptional regulator [unclassified Crossiella]MCK2244781.1 MarR family transcriptional regulator [Crossiella sp. S99.2]MCK2258423.1 MarR family transcriptional regulator [Crossiella sp. S99.1]